MTERPSAIVAGQLVLTRRGAGMLLAALQLAMKHAERDAVSYQGRSQWDDVSWLREQARLVAEGRTGPASADSADETVPVRFRVTLPGSEVIWGTRQAAELAGVTRRAVVAAIRRGDLPRPGSAANEWSGNSRPGSTPGGTGEALSTPAPRRVRVPLPGGRISIDPVAVVDAAAAAGRIHPASRDAWLVRVDLGLDGGGQVGDGSHDVIGPGRGAATGHPAPYPLPDGHDTRPGGRVGGQGWSPGRPSRSFR